MSDRPIPITPPIPTALQARADAPPFPGAGGDAGILRVEGVGPEHLTLAEFTSTDRDFAPLHHHPWDELTYVIEGEIEVRLGPSGELHRGGPGAVVSLPARVPHSVRVPEGEARYLLISVGAPSAPFLREMGEVYAAGPTPEAVVAVATRHGVGLA